MSRTQFVIQSTPELDAALDEIRLATDRPERGEVLRDALELYDLLVHHVKRGKRLYIGDDRDGSAEVKLPQLLHARKYRGLAVIDGGKKR